MIGYFSPAAGFLTGKYRSKEIPAHRARADMVPKYLDDRGMWILAAPDRAAGLHGLAPAKIALAGLMAQPGITAPIVNATRLEQMGSIMYLPADSAVLILERI